ncbi:12634_t:CDS:2, partial [Acaulospora morrowiae]
VIEKVEELPLIIKEVIDETSSLQPPPPYEVIDEAQNNNISSEVNQSNVVSNHENVSSNMSSSQNNSNVKQGEWSGVLEKEVENFENILERVLGQVPSEDVERKKKLRSFGTGKKLAKRYGIITSERLMPVVILLLQHAWHENANANLRSLKCDVGWCINESASYEKTMWERIEMELKEINVEDLGFDHPICSGVLDLKSVPFTNIPGSVCDTFKEPFQKYKLEQNHNVMDTCKEFIRNEESKINIDENQCKPLEISFAKPAYMILLHSHLLKGKSINEGSYVCEVLAPLLNIVMSNLPGNPIAWDIWGEEGSSASAIRKGSRKIARRADYMMMAQLGKNAKLEIVYLETGRPDSTQDKRLRDHKKLIRFFKDSIDTTRSVLKLKKIFNQSSKRQNLSIFTINVAGDVIELYAMHRELGIYRYCLIEEASIPLHITSANAVYPLIHTLLTLRTAVACTIHKILHNFDSGDSEHSSSEMTTTVPTP